MKSKRIKKLYFIYKKFRQMTAMLFQTLSAISTEQSSTIVFPFPIDTLCLSMGQEKDKRKSD